MGTTLYHLTTAAAILVLIVLVLGLSTLLRKNSANMSQQLMRWRVGLQFVAIVVIMAAIYFRR